MMEKERICEKIMELETDYHKALLEEDSWRDCYAVEHFSEFPGRIVELLRVIRDEYSSKFSKALKYSVIALISEFIEKDYSTLHSRVFRLDWEDREVYMILDALNDKFKEQLDNAMHEMKEICLALKSI